MDRTRQSGTRMRRERRQTQMLLIAAAIVLFCGLFAQIAVRAQVAGQAKQIAAVKAQIHALSAEADNLTLCINQHHDLEAIGKRALAMGMGQPTEDQLRRVSLPAAGNTSTQTVANIGGEEING